MISELIHKNLVAGLIGGLVIGAAFKHGNPTMKTPYVVIAGLMGVVVGCVLLEEMTSNHINDMQSTQIRPGVPTQPNWTNKP